jgi:hypothetical protein
VLGENIANSGRGKIKFVRWGEGGGYCGCQTAAYCLNKLSKLDCFYIPLLSVDCRLRSGGQDLFDQIKNRINSGHRENARTGNQQQQIAATAAVEDPDLFSEKEIFREQERLRLVLFSNWCDHCNL